jgi:hypothetical protein
VSGHTGSPPLTRPQLRLCDSHHYWTPLTLRAFRCHDFSRDLYQRTPVYSVRLDPCSLSYLNPNKPQNYIPESLSTSYPTNRASSPNWAGCGRVQQRFDHRKLSSAEVKEQYQFKISNRFAALENLDDDVDINRTWENIRENIKIQPKRTQVIMSFGR